MQNDVSIEICSEYSRCVICLNSPPTMLQFDAPIDVEGIQICCGTMYKSFVGLVDDIVTNINTDQLKLCLLCLAQLNSCYIFQRKAVQSAEFFFGKIGDTRDTTQDVHTICEEMVEEFGQENNIHGFDEEDLSRDENIVCPYEENVLDESFGTCIVASATECKEPSPEATNLIDRESVDSKLIVHTQDECDANEDLIEYEAENPFESIEFDTEDTVLEGEQIIKIVVAKDRALQCVRCAQGMDTKATFREHFLKDHYVKASDTKHHCTLCNRWFKSRKTFLQHLPTHQAMKAFSCPICMMSFHYSHQLKAHEQSHRTDKLFECTQCSKTFKSKIYLKTHKARHDAGDKYACDMCTMCFNHFPNLLKHKLLKHDARARNFKPVVCEKCDKMLYSRSAVSYHAKLRCDQSTTGHDSWYIYCIVCRQHFETRGQLEQHIKAEHSTEEQQHPIRQNDSKSSAYECDVCGRRFSQIVILRRHKLRHEGIKPYQCDHCQRSFTQKGTLKTHLRTHSKEQPHRGTSSHGHE